MNTKKLKLLLNRKRGLELREIIYRVYAEVPEANALIDSLLPDHKKTIKQNKTQLFKRYKRQFYDYLLPNILESDVDDVAAYELLERIRKNNIDTQLVIDCEFQFVTYCKEFILTYGYFDEDYYISMEEVFESACKKIKEKGLIEDYKETVEKLLQFGDEYGLGFSEICEDLGIYKT